MVKASAMILCCCLIKLMSSFSLMPKSSAKYNVLKIVKIFSKKSDVI